MFTKDNIEGFHIFLSDTLSGIEPFENVSKEKLKTALQEILYSETEDDIFNLIKKYNTNYDDAEARDLAEKLILYKSKMNVIGKIDDLEGDVKTSFLQILIIVVSVIVAYETNMWILPAIAGGIATVIYKKYVSKYALPIGEKALNIIETHCKLCKYYETDSDFCKKLDKDINLDNFKECEGRYYKESVIKKFNQYRSRLDSPEANYKIPSQVECMNCKGVVEFDEKEYKLGIFICPDCGKENIIKK